MLYRKALFTINMTQNKVVMNGQEVMYPLQIAAPFTSIWSTMLSFF